nr:6743_t:CDS:2 [Entrophospora candida]
MFPSAKKCLNNININTEVGSKNQTCSFYTLLKNGKLRKHRDLTASQKIVLEEGIENHPDLQRLELILVMKAATSKIASPT